MKKFLAVLFIALLLVAIIGCNRQASSTTTASTNTAAATPTVNRSSYFITVLTGPTSGIYYPIGGAFSNYLQEIGYRTSATATGASAENINYILTGQGELSIAMVDSVIQAYEAYGGFEGRPPALDLRAMMGLWPNYCQIVTTADSGIRTFEDMKGKRVGVGAPNSGVELNARMMFEAHGMTYNDCRVDYLNYGQAIEEMKDGRCDVAFVTSGLGNATILELGVSKTIYFVPVEGAPLQNLLRLYPFYIDAVIPKEVYGTQEDTRTAAVINIMLVSKDLPNDVVYDMLDQIYSPAGVSFIGASHATAAENIMLSTALRGIRGTVIPLHDGASQFYRAKGLL
ncbi:MAG: TAXI family TRAP transporter solute-binding subunit [Treponema sp.]|jgi:TRAP transporter TAXI family solute receptor|nr:TAXI family TRAP transporter solute-binding subunit [Treponema sp.]